jgi:hypothetical protein
VPLDGNISAKVKTPAISVSGARSEPLLAIW